MSKERQRLERDLVKTDRLLSEAQNAIPVTVDTRWLFPKEYARITTAYDLIERARREILLASQGR